MDWMFIILSRFFSQNDQSRWPNLKLDTWGSQLEPRNHLDKTFLGSKEEATQFLFKIKSFFLFLFPPNLSNQSSSADPALVPTVCCSAGDETQVHVEHFPVYWVCRRTRSDKGKVTLFRESCIGSKFCKKQTNKQKKFLVCRVWIIMTIVTFLLASP